MKNLIVGLVVGCVLGALVLGHGVKAQSIFVGTAGGQCGDVNSDRSARIPAAYLERNMDELMFWEQGFVDGALAANGQQSRESMKMVDARFASFCTSAGRREYTMRQVGMQIIKDMKTATWP